MGSSISRTVRFSATAEGFNLQSGSMRLVVLLVVGLLASCGDNLRPAADAAASCGDGTCNPNESCTTCEVDCGLCAGCGDASCDAAGGETCANCVVDCGVCESCGDGLCDAAGGEDCAS